MGVREPDQDARRSWLSILAKAEPAEVEERWRLVLDPPPITVLRQPEIGLVMARGRIGGSGARFNLGEVPVARCSVRTPDGTVGHGYVQGRSKRQAELVARLDALLQDPARHERLMEDVVRPLAAAQAERRARIERRAAATRVDFFTMVRGE